MGEFLNTERVRQAKFKMSSPLFSQNARADGLFKGKNRPFCLPLECASENLFCEIREQAIRFFREKEIKWHQGQNGYPSNHMCDSQVSCVNFLFPFVDKGDMLVKLFKPLFPKINRPISMEGSEQLITFEWIGKENYLGEKVSGNGKRTRGANFTSADAAVMFECVDGKRQIILIEWKYTESYSSVNLRIAKSGTDRTEIYQHLFSSNDCPLDKELLSDFEDLFYEPFYQFMRQQFLAHQMEKANELGADIVTLLHIAPEINKDFRQITSPNLANLGRTVVEVWKNLVKSKHKFMSVTVEQFFRSMIISQLPELQTWSNYISERYSWVVK
jgi:hypothetical protein